MKKLTRSIFALLILNGPAFCQTTLTPGDMVIIAQKTNNNTDGGNDALKFMNLVDLDCNTQFIITDNNWNGSAWACDDDECGVQITCNSFIPAGSVFYIEMNASGDP